MLTIFLDEIRYYMKNTQEVLYYYGFLLTILLLFPFMMRQDLVLLNELAFPMLWVALASVVSIGASQVWERDERSGRLEQYALFPLGAEPAVFIKWLSFYFVTLIPLGFLLPLAGLLAGTPVLAMLIAIVPGAAALTAIASLVSGMLAGQVRGGAVLSLITLPLMIPVVIFGAQSVQDGVLIAGPFLFLVGMASLFVPLMCLAVSGTLRSAS